jgi:hypothetical protein
MAIALPRCPAPLAVSDRQLAHCERNGIRAAARENVASVATPAPGRT